MEIAAKPCNFISRSLGLSCTFKVWQTQLPPGYFRPPWAVLFCRPGLPCAAASCWPAIYPIPYPFPGGMPLLFALKQMTPENFITTISNSLIRERAPDQYYRQIPSSPICIFAIALDITGSFAVNNQYESGSISAIPSSFAMRQLILSPVLWVSEVFYLF